MMNRLELRTVIRSVLREPVPARWSDNDLNRYINKAIEDVSLSLSRQMMASLQQSTETFNMPDDCLILTEVYWNDNPIERELGASIPTGTDTGTPSRYWLIDDVGYLRPIPDIEGTMKLMYYYSLPSMVADTDEPPLKGMDNLIHAHAVYQAYFEDGDPQFQIWRQRRDEEFISFIGTELNNYSTGFQVKENF